MYLVNRKCTQFRCCLLSKICELYSTNRVGESRSMCKASLDKHDRAASSCSDPLRILQESCMYKRS